MKANKNNLSVSHIHLKHINPLPKNLGEVLLKYNKVLIPEINLGQLSNIIRSKYLIDTLNYNRVSGKPFTTSDIYNKISEFLLLTAVTPGVPYFLVIQSANK